MKNFLLPLACVFVFALSLKAQTAPVVWERYRLADKKVSILLPKLATADEYTNYCHENKTVTYNAYADGVAYQVSLVRKFSNPGTIVGCAEQTTFGARGLEVRLEAIRDRANPPEEKATTVGGLEVYKFKTESSTRWVISDITKGKRWIELAAVYYPDAKPNLDRFFNSLELAGSPGKDIGDGSSVMLGDLAVGPDDKTMNSAVTSPYIVVFRPFPRYKDIFSKKASGRVKLNVVLRANGSIGTITRVEESRSGAGDPAVEAAKRIVFLPKRVDGVPVDAEMTLEYSLEITN